MAKKRIHQLAKELEVASADILHKAQELGIEVKTASSGLTPEEEELVVMSYEEDKIVEENEAEDTSNQEKLEDEEKAQEEDKKVEEKDVNIIEVTEGSTPDQLSELIDEDSTQIVADLMSLGIMQSVTSNLSNDEIEKLLEKYNYIPEFITKVEIKRSEIINEVIFEDEEKNLKVRSPIITVMGHVDHGKTSLLDFIRKEKVAENEAGGITQHVGAYKIESGEQGITFIDTPGHEAFTQMRARGANVTDIVVLVVAADDGIMPQTIEAINHAKSAQVPIVVAINKCDLQEANPTLVKADLTKYEIIAEDLGGDIPIVEISALKGDGIDDLLETLSLVAEIEELKSVYETEASGYIIESRMEVGKGNVATVIVTRGASGSILSSDVFNNLECPAFNTKVIWFISIIVTSYVYYEYYIFHIFFINSKRLLGLILRIVIKSREIEHVNHLVEIVNAVIKEKELRDIIINEETCPALKTPFIKFELDNRYLWRIMIFITNRLLQR